ncbi:AraC family transcriptional regulator [Paenibacillus swuensis]|uniref:AraC family transcriptional regulator n=1 Tax=Paenibacillus swuensis TaxID=1178515 RepID=A0A172TIM7_9BACL|nr:helix-turn-helix domain-containing protein [Paenibacillus swuensis]ANE46888.1 AraC family transcriptional regulator [Paenibacillus swuensis]
MAQGNKPNMGILHRQEGERNFRLMRYTPSEEVGRFVMHYWTVSWNLEGQPPYEQHVVPNPCVNLVVERGRTAVYGPGKEKFAYHLAGQGRVFGVKFKPGGFYPFTRKSVSGLSDEPQSVKEVLGIDAIDLEQIILNDPSEESMVRKMENLLIHKLPPWDETVEHITNIVEIVARSREVTRVDTLCETVHMNVRTLQRLFEQYVGVSPKWVIQLYRLQNAAEQLERDVLIDWISVAADLGYYDQSHFIKDFRTVIGQTPEEYMRAINVSK